jgi:hypothetical protein
MIAIGSSSAGAHGGGQGITTGRVSQNKQIVQEQQNIHNVEEKTRINVRAHAAGVLHCLIYKFRAGANLTTIQPLCFVS